MHALRFALLLSLALPLLPVPAAAGQLAKQKLSAQPTHLLAGRLLIRLPQGTRIEARRRSIMSAPEPTQEETRAVLEAGAEKLVLMAYELFALRGDKLEASVEQALKQYWPGQGKGMTLKPLALRSPETVAVRPAKLMGADAVLVLGVYTALPDRTVQLLNFYVNPEAAKDEAGCRALVDKIAGTLAPGKRTLASKAGERKLAGVGPALRVTVPAGFIATTQPGPDFVVHRLRKLAPLGGSSSSIGIYVGGHPAYQHRQQSIPDKNVRQTSAMLLGQKVSWHEWTRPRKDSTSALTAEVILPPAAGGGAMHIFITAEGAAQVGELKKVVATLKR